MHTVSRNAFPYFNRENSPKLPFVAALGSVEVDDEAPFLLIPPGQQSAGPIVYGGGPRGGADGLLCSQLPGDGGRWTCPGAGQPNVSPVAGWPPAAVAERGA